MWVCVCLFAPRSVGRSIHPSTKPQFSDEFNLYSLNMNCLTWTSKYQTLRSEVVVPNGCKMFKWGAHSFATPPNLSSSTPPELRILNNDVRLDWKAFAKVTLLWMLAVWSVLWQSVITIVIEFDSKWVIGMCLFCCSGGFQYSWLFLYFYNFILIFFKTK